MFEYMTKQYVIGPYASHPTRLDDGLNSEAKEGWSAHTIIPATLDDFGNMLSAIVVYERAIED